MNQALSFGLLAAGGVFLIHAVTGNSFGEILQGHAGSIPTSGQDLTSAGAGPTAFATTPPSSGSIASMVRQLSADYGWNGTQQQAWLNVISRESGGNPNARNRSSGAYGIGQFLGSTLKQYAPYGATSSDPAKQLNAMGLYIKDRYGTPANAWAHEQQFGWY